MGDTSRDTQGVGGGGGGGGEGGVREILAVVTQSDLSRSHVSWWEGGRAVTSRFVFYLSKSRSRSTKIYSSRSRSSSKKIYLSRSRK